MRILSAARRTISIPVFEGPLDLLLSLIEREELDITAVSLARVTDQYLAHLAALEEQRVSELADFLVIAAKLLLIKSQALLPRPPTPTPEAEDVGAELVLQLQTYKRFKEIAKVLGKWDTEGQRSFARIAPLPRLEPHLDLGDVTINDLLAAVQQALDALPAPPVDQVVAPTLVTVEDRIEAIERHLTRRAEVSFQAVLAEARTRIEIIVTLQALLEMIKRDKVVVRQTELFGEITILRRPPEPAEASAAPATSPAAP